MDLFSNLAMNDWKVSYMGHSIVSLKDRFVFDAPLARFKEYPVKVPNPLNFKKFNTYPRTMGSIVSVNTINRKSKIANGEWSKKFHSDFDGKDSHTDDMTGSAIVAGHFYTNDLGHFAIGSPKSDNMYGRVYICYNCFYSMGRPIRAHPKDMVIKHDKADSLMWQKGARFGETLAAVDINGDGIDDLIAGAPLFTSKV